MNKKTKCPKIDFPSLPGIWAPVSLYLQSTFVETITQISEFFFSRERLRRPWKFCSWNKRKERKLHSPMPLPANALGWTSCASRDTTLKEAKGVEPGCVEIIPRKRVTFHVRTWLYSEQMDTRFFSLSITFTTGFRWTMNVWKSCGPWPTVSGCCTITLTVPELVPYAISIQFPLKPEDKTLIALRSLWCCWQA